MSSKFQKVKSYYEHGFWTVSMIKNAVTKNWITAEEFEEITGTVYEE